MGFFFKYGWNVFLFVGVSKLNKRVRKSPRIIFSLLGPKINVLMIHSHVYLNLSQLFITSFCKSLESNSPWKSPWLLSSAACMCLAWMKPVFHRLKICWWSSVYQCSCSTMWVEALHGQKIIYFLEFENTSSEVFLTDVTILVELTIPMSVLKMYAWSFKMVKGKLFLRFCNILKRTLPFSRDVYKSFLLFNLH